MIAAGFRLLSRLLFRVEITGLENIPSTNTPEGKKLLIIANYESLLDGLLLGLFLPMHITFVVENTLLNKWLFRQFLCLTPYLVINPYSPIGVKKIIKLLELGRSVIIFPQTHTRQNGGLTKVYDNLCYIAAKTGALILPVHLDSPAGSFFSRLIANKLKNVLSKVTFTILPSIHIDMLDAPNAKQRQNLTGGSMHQTIQNILFGSAPVQTLFDAFLDAKNMHGRKMQLVEDIRQVEENYGELLTKILALGRLISKVTKVDENVGVLMPNITNTICLVYGMSAFKRVPAMLNYTTGAVGVQNACTVANIKTIISSRQFIEAGNLEQIVNGLKTIQIVYLEDLKLKFSIFDKLWLVGFAGWFPRLAIRLLSNKAHPNDPAVVLFTSGSEGKHKGVVHSHSSLLANTVQIKSVIDFSPTDKFMIALPLFHAFGFTCGAILPLIAGTRLLLYPSPLHYRVIPGIIYNRGCTVLFGTSTFLANYAKFAKPNDFCKLRYVIAGAERLNEEVRKTWLNKFAIPILEGYGATECAPVLSVNTPMANKIGSVGRLMPGLIPKMESVPGIVDGKLLFVKGPNVMLGYYLFDNPGIIQPLVDGWYNTGDVVDIDAEGFVIIKGRVKRFAKVAGEMVSLETAEQLANSASPEQQHAASTQPDAQRGENILLFTTDACLSREALQAKARELSSPEIAVARKIIIVKELPLLGTGKIDYVTLKKLAETV